MPTQKVWGGRRPSGFWPLPQSATRASLGPNPRGSAEPLPDRAPIPGAPATTATARPSNRSCGPSPRAQEVRCHRSFRTTSGSVRTSGSSRRSSRSPTSSTFRSGRTTSSFSGRRPRRSATTSVCRPSSRASFRSRTSRTGLLSSTCPLTWKTPSTMWTSAAIAA